MEKEKAKVGYMVFDPIGWALSEDTPFTKQEALERIKEYNLPLDEDLIHLNEKENMCYVVMFEDGFVECADTLEELNTKMKNYEDTTEYDTKWLED